ncbi:MAG TPA: PEP-CTERM sorting domain-containing protein, partial [Tepidisphaeraceae bacterium]|nr:PEP-CTERM sorting domain-containing protein [Tepidisphaeraceae bacterium]
MRAKRKNVAIAVLAGVSAVAMSHAAQGAAIDIQFAGNKPELQPTDVAGVVPEANWNATTLASWSGGTTLDLSDNSGSLTTATLSGSASGPYFGGGISDGSPGDSVLTAGEVYSGWSGPGTGSLMTFSTIPYSNYEVIVEASIDSTGRNETIGLTPGGGSTSYWSFTTMGGGNAWIPATDPAVGWDGSTGSQPATVSANYAIFTGETASSFVLNWGAPGNGAINGVQIIETAGVPEPMSLGILGIGAAMSLVRRRRTSVPPGT